MIRIGTRNSALALAQTEIVKNKILQKFPDEQIETVPIVTTGDMDRIRPLGEFGGKGVFTIEIEKLLGSGDIDIAVHSAKDLPMESEAGLVIAAAIEREDPRDVLLVNADKWQTTDGKGKVIGTSSLRRELQIKQIYPKVQIKPLRGNVGTRIRRLKDGEYDGIILAAAGIKRLGLDQEDGISYIYLPEDQFIPAAGQGIIAVQANSETLDKDRHLYHVLHAINDEEAYRALLCERVFLQTMNGGCNAPCGIYVENKGDSYILHGMYSKDGKTVKYMSEKSALLESAELETTISETLATASEVSVMTLEATATASQALTEVTCKNNQLTELSKTLAYKLRKGRVSIVGAGIGGYDMMTLKALECVKKADVIVYDDLLSPSILNEAKSDARLIYVGKRAGVHHKSQAEIQEVIIKNALAGLYVVRLKGGDPYVFGRGGEEALALSGASIEYEVVPGISSSYCVPAYAGIPVTHRGKASSVHVITGHRAEDNGQIDYSMLAKLEGTLVFLMGMSHLQYIADNLIENGMSEDKPAAVIMQGGSARQKVVTAALKDIYHTAIINNMKTPAIIVIGDTVGLRDVLKITEHKSLSGKKILLTATKETADNLTEKLLPLGAEPVTLSLINTRQTTFNLQPDKLREFSWIVFLSPAGIKYFFKGLYDNRIDVRNISGAKFAVVGESTADKLREYGYNADYIPDSFRIKALADKWVPELKTSDKVLLVRSKMSDELADINKNRLLDKQENKHFEYKDALYTALDKAGIQYSTGLFYETYVDMRRQEEFGRLLDDMDAVVVCSSSAAKAIHLMTDKKLNRCVAIGPETARTLESLNISVSKVADKYNSEGIVGALVDILGTVNQ